MWCFRNYVPTVWRTFLVFNQIDLCAQVWICLFCLKINITLFKRVVYAEMESILWFYWESKCIHIVYIVWLFPSHYLCIFKYWISAGMHIVTKLIFEFESGIQNFPKFVLSFGPFDFQKEWRVGVGISTHFVYQLICH